MQILGVGSRGRGVLPEKLLQLRQIQIRSMTLEQKLSMMNYFSFFSTSSQQSTPRAIQDKVKPKTPDQQ